MTLLRNHWRLSVSALLALPALSLGFVSASIVSYSGQSDAIASDAAIVLGAAVSNGSPTPVFEQRIAHGVNLYHGGMVRALILTGGVGAGDSLAESEVARDYCLAHGVPAEALFVETQSRSTSENLLQACAIAEEIGARRVLVVSDPLHELRAITIARDLGLDAYPSPTPTSRYVGIAKQARFLARETYFYSRYLLHRTFGSDADA